MLDLFDKIYSSKEPKRTPAVVFLDIKKAFDSVDREKLIAKLKHYGIEGSALEWFRSYLNGRRQQTKIGNKLSDLAFILFGVPQGSILGPILFSIYINYLASVCEHSFPFLFADDGTLYFDNVERGALGFTNIKSELINVCKWLQVNKLSLNIGKTSFYHSLYFTM